MAIDPASELKPPETDPRWDQFNNRTGFSQYLSPSYLAGAFAKWALGQNPWDEASKMIAGDWESVAKSGQAIRHLSNFNVAYANALNEGTRPLFADHWKGRAAKDAGNYFVTLEGALREQAQPLKYLGDQVIELAYGVFQMADTIKGLLEALTDVIFTAGIATAVKAIAGGVQVPALIQRVRQIWNAILDAYNKGVARSRFIVSLWKGYGADIRPDSFTSISDTPYNYPGVPPVGPAGYISGMAI